MGLDLDMYLEYHIYVGANFEHRNVTGTIDLKCDGEPIDVHLHKVNSIIEYAGYWRKANAIHKWFVDNVQGGNDNCEQHWVSKEQLKELLDTVNTVLASIKIENGLIVNTETAEELLPTQSGFFFGGTDYDEYYTQYLLDTKEILERALEDDRDGDYYYQSSW